MKTVSSLTTAASNCVRRACSSMDGGGLVDEGGRQLHLLLSMLEVEIGVALQADGT
jgi:hypothetical protein